jgi:signal peptidase I
MNDDRATGDQALTNAQDGSSLVGDDGPGGADPLTVDPRAPDPRAPDPRAADPRTADGGPSAGADGDSGPEPEPGVPPAASGSRSRPARTQRKSIPWWVELPALVVFALVLMLVIKTYAIQAFFIPSSSMENTLDIGDKVLVNKLVYHFRPIGRGDIIVFNGDGSWDPATPAGSSDPVIGGFDRLGHAIVGLFGISPGVHDYIKRVIGVPGDHVACCDASGQVTVNGVPLSEKSYLYPGNPPSLVRFSVTVPPGRLWVMGDHRSVSYDSRGHRGDPGGGTIPESQVVGRAFVIMWPPSRAGLLNIPATFEQPKLTASAMAGGPAVAVPLAGAVLLLPARRLRRRVRRRVRSRAAFVRRRLGWRVPPGRGPEPW